MCCAAGSTRRTPRHVSRSARLSEITEPPPLPPVKRAAPPAPPASTMRDMSELWGAETRKAIDNFPVSGRPIPVGVVRWLGRIKAAAARVNAELGLLEPELAARIAAAGDAIAAGEHDDQFPIDVFQTGSGTSSNMNANEVMAALAGEGAHPNDHVNLGQTSNDVFPSAVHLAALDEIQNRLLPALDQLHSSLAATSEEFPDHATAGRTHPLDPVPVTLAHEFREYAAQHRLAPRRERARAPRMRPDPGTCGGGAGGSAAMTPRARHRLAGTAPRVVEIPLGGPATGTGLNTPPEFAGRARQRLAADTGLPISA